MAKVTLMGLLNVKSTPYFIEAENLEELMKKLTLEDDVLTVERLKSCVIMVNGKPVDLLPEFVKIPLKEDDEVLFIRPIAGG